MMTTVDEIAKSAAKDENCPDGMSPTANVLWLAKAGQWDAAHDLCQDLPDPDGAWIHAWLHREEGDYSNACCWYARAGKPAVAEDASLPDEWHAIARELLA